MKVELLARAMIDVFLAHLVVGKEDGFEKEDVMFWALAYFEATAGDDLSVERAKRLTREILAYRQAIRRMKKSRAGKPENVVALLLYNISHSGPRDRLKRLRWEARLKKKWQGFEIQSVEEAVELIEELRGTYLPEKAFHELFGRTLNLDRIARMVEEEYTALAKEGGHV